MLKGPMLKLSVDWTQIETYIPSQRNNYSSSALPWPPSECVDKSYNYPVAALFKLLRSLDQEEEDRAGKSLSAQFETSREVLCTLLCQFILSAEALEEEQGEKKHETKEEEEEELDPTEEREEEVDERDPTEPEGEDIEHVQKTKQKEEQNEEEEEEEEEVSQKKDSSKSRQATLGELKGGIILLECLRRWLQPSVTMMVMKWLADREKQTDLQQGKPDQFFTSQILLRLRTKALIAASWPSCVRVSNVWCYLPTYLVVVL